MENRNGEESEVVADDKLGDIKDKKDLHIVRKVFHFLPAFSYVMVYALYPEFRVHLENYIYKIFILAFMFDYLRLKNEKMNKTVTKLFKVFMRKEEVKSNSGVPSYVASMAIITALFPSPVVILSLLYLSVCDPAASFFGVLLKDVKGNFKFSNGKSLFGYLACFISAFIITVSVGFVLEWDMIPILVTATLSSLLVATVECFPLEDINDNLLVPMSSAIFLTILLFIQGVL